jgi:hypothetical protein
LFPPIGGFAVLFEQQIRRVLGGRAAGERQLRGLDVVALTEVVALDVNDDPDVARRRARGLVEQTACSQDRKTYEKRYKNTENFLPAVCMYMNPAHCAIPPCSIMVQTITFKLISNNKNAGA